MEYDHSEKSSIVDKTGKLSELFNYTKPGINDLAERALVLEIGLGENKVTSDMLEVIKVELSEITMLSVTLTI